MLTAFYDLAVCPAKYDFLGFLLDAERHRQLTGKDKIRFVFVPGPNKGFREDTLPPHSIPHREMMLQNIVYPMCHLLGVDIELVKCGSRDQAFRHMQGEIFPTEYTVNDPTSHYGTHIIMRNFERGFFPLRSPDRNTKDKSLITITLRESHYWPMRNSNRAVWIKAAERLKDAGFKVVFVLDVDSPPLEGWEVNKPASTNLIERANLYETAHHNFFVSNGCAWMAAAMKNVSGTMFKLTSETHSLCSEKFWTNIGYPKDSQIRDDFRLVWEEDSEGQVMPIIEQVINKHKQ